MNEGDALLSSVFCEGPASFMRRLASYFRPAAEEQQSNPPNRRQHEVAKHKMSKAELAYTCAFKYIYIYIRVYIYMCVSVRDAAN